MQRALAEYQVLGVRTTIPFFLWMMRQPEYHAGEYDTTYLDALLQRRTGSFSELSPDDEDLVAMAAAVDAHIRASQAAGGDGGVSRTGLWKAAGRREALRS